MWDILKSDHALTVDNKGDGNGRRNLIGLQYFALRIGEQNWVSNVTGFRPSLFGLEAILIEHDAKKLDASSGIAFLNVGEGRYLIPAGRAPRGEEIQKDDLAIEIVKVNISPVEVL